MNMTINEVDNKLNSLRTEIHKLVNSMQFITIQEFDINISDEDIKKIKKAHNYKGIYFFEIKADSTIPYEKWIEKFVKDWDKEFEDLKHVPTTKIIRTSKHNKVLEWMPLYIGKRLNVGDRIEKHINLKFDSSTFGIKFKVRQNFKDAKFRLSILRLDVENYDMIAPVIESHFREKFNPIVGKQ